MSISTRPDTPIEEQFDVCCEDRENFLQLYQRYRLDGDNGQVDRRELRAAARALRDSGDKLAATPADGDATSADLKEAYGGNLLCLAAVHNETWFHDLAKRQAERIVATRPGAAEQEKLTGRLVLEAAGIGSCWSAEIADRLSECVVDMLVDPAEMERFAFRLLVGAAALRDGRLSDLAWLVAKRIVAAHADEYSAAADDALGESVSAWGAQ